ncbi:MAG: hypothetical protein WC421_02190 [Elusimicrobiales bacterium]
MRRIFGMILAVAAVPAFAGDAAVPPMLGGVVKSDKWTMHRAEGTEEFSGNVRYRSDQYEMRADWGLYNRNTGEFRTSGNIDGAKRWPDGALSRARSDKALYRMKEETALLESDAGRLVRIDHSSPVYGVWNSVSKTAFADQNARFARLEKEVVITSTSSVAHCDSAVYRYSEDGRHALFDLYGRPVITGVHDGYDYAVVGDTAAADIAMDKFTITGRVKGWIRPAAGSRHGASRSFY